MRVNVDKLIRARRLKRWTVAELAKKCNRTENAIYKVEQGKRASEKTVYAMSRVLGVPMEDILVDEEEEVLIENGNGA